MAWDTSTWVPGIPNAANFNARVRDNMKVLGDPWTAYTPTLSNWTLGNGSLTGFAVQANKLIIGRINYVVGSTDTKSGTLLIGLPATPHADLAASAIGQGGIQDVSVPSRFFRHACTSGGSVYLADGADTRVSNTVPFTFATGDIVRILFQYEAA